MEHKHTNCYCGFICLGGEYVRPCDIRSIGGNKVHLYDGTLIPHTRGSDATADYVNESIRRDKANATK